MALEFPGATVVGIDLAPAKLNTGKVQLPANCRYEVHDANSGLDDWTGAVDVLHARSIEPGVRDYDLFLYDSARCLKPNGVLLLITGIAVSSSLRPILLKGDNDSSSGREFTTKTMRLSRQPMKGSLSGSDSAVTASDDLTGFKGSPGFNQH